MTSLIPPNQPPHPPSGQVPYTFAIYEIDSNVKVLTLSQHRIYGTIPNLDDIWMNVGLFILRVVHVMYVYIYVRVQHNILNCPIWTVYDTFYGRSMR